MESVSMKFEKINTLKDWFLLEEIPGSSPILLAGTFRRMTEQFNTEFNIPIKMNLLYKNNTLFLYFLHKQLNLSSHTLLDKALDDTSFLADIDQRNKEVQKKLIKYADNLDVDFSKLTDEELLIQYENFALLLEKAIVAGWVDNILEFENELFSGYLRNYLSEIIKTKNSPRNVAEVFNIFSTPDRETHGATQERALQNISQQIRQNEQVLNLFISASPEEIEQKLAEISVEINNSIDEHTEKYDWHFFMYEGPGWKKIDFITALKEILKQPSKSNMVADDIVEIKSALANELSIDQKHAELLHQASEIIFNKDLRKHAVYYTSYRSIGLLDEIAKRLNISIQEVRLILPWEMRQIFNTNNSICLIKSREAGLLMKFYQGETELGNAQEANEFYNKVKASEKKSENVSEIKGSCAYPGLVTGIAKIVNSPADMSKIEEGNVLVSHQTDPDILPAMKLAAAFVTDLGGITCHAAIVSREMKKPCVVGTKIGSQVIRDGDFLEVDANSGIVKILKRA